MVVPLAARWVAAVFGILLLLTGWSSVIGTLIVPRPVGSWLTRGVDRMIVAVYRAVKRHIPDYGTRDRILATQAAAILITQLLGWLAIIFVGYTLLLWPMSGRGIAAAFIDAGSSIFTLGFAEPPGTAPAVVVFLAAGSGLVIVALQIGYLPTLYNAFNRLGTGTAGTHPLRTRLGLDAQHAARAVHELGTLGRGCRGEPQHLPAARQVPLAWRSLLLADFPALGARLRGAHALPRPRGRADRASQAVPARRVPVLPPHRAGDGLRGASRGRPGCGDHADLRGVP